MLKRVPISQLAADKYDDESLRAKVVANVARAGLTAAVELGVIPLPEEEYIIAHFQRLLPPEQTSIKKGGK